MHQAPKRPPCEREHFFSNVPPFTCEQPRTIPNPEPSHRGLGSSASTGSGYRGCDMLYYMRRKINGRIFRETLGTGNRKLAEKQLAIRTEELKSPPTNSLPQPTLEEVCQKFCKNKVRITSMNRQVRLPFSVFQTVRQIPVLFCSRGVIGIHKKHLGAYLARPLFCL